MGSPASGQQTAWGTAAVDDNWAGDGLLLVVGHASSGTTITGKLLGAHPDAVYVEEPALAAFGLRVWREVRSLQNHTVHDAASSD